MYVLEKLKFDTINEAQMYQKFVKVWVMLIFEGPTLPVKHWKGIKALFFYFNLCRSVRLGSLTFSFTHIFFLANTFFRDIVHIVYHNKM